MIMEKILTVKRGATMSNNTNLIQPQSDNSPNFDNWTCPMPLRDYPRIVMGHGGGGKLGAELIEHLFMPAFKGEGDSELATMGDAAALMVGEVGTQARIAFSTDSFVVRPLFFPGGSIGDLAVHGTVNDLAMRGATPLYLSAGFIIEEGLAMNTLGGIATLMGQAARNAGVQIVTGDTKVVDRGHGDGVYINTAGVGVIPAGIDIAPQNAKVGDVVICSGTLGDHGMAIMSVREGLSFDTQIVSDSAALNHMVAALLQKNASAIHVMRDPTRGGVASALNEIAQAAKVGILLDESKIPVRPAVQAACEMLGMDPLYIANEGKMLAIVAREHADEMLEVMRSQKHGEDAVIIGEVVAQHAGILATRTTLGATRVVDMQVGEQLPRIC
jgi:hydrogenase expression/formation protein HypE